jgi:phage shock protein PspC (stress-responsive transcriptional regulator)
MAARLVRPQQGRMIAGVCAGLSERFGVSVTLIRILFLVFAVVGAAEILYLILWIIVPKE